MTPIQSTSPRPRLVAAAIVLAAALALASCGSSASTGSAGSGSGQTTTRHIAFAKTKFLLHAGLAFGAFHRYIYKPFRSGGFSPPTRHKAAIVKAGLAAVFAYHEAKIALQDAQASPLLSKLVAPLTALQRQLSGLGTRLKTGSLDSSGISAANTTVNGISSASAHDYKAIHDVATPSLERLARLQDDDRNTPPGGASLVCVKARVVVVDQAPELLALGVLRLSRPNRESLALDLGVDVRVRLEIVIPGGVLLGAGLGGDHDQVVPAWREQHRRGAGPACLGPAHVQQDGLLGRGRQSPAGQAQQALVHGREDGDEQEPAHA